MKVFLLTLPDGTFGSAGQSWKQLSLDKLISKLDFEVTIKTIVELDSIDFSDDDILIYTSSESEEIRSFLKNSLYYLRERVKLIPSYDVLMAHEDKSFQEVWKNKDSFGDLEGRSIFDLNDQSLPFPKVLKNSQGAGSSGVFLARNKQDLKKIKKFFFGKSLKSKLVGVQRKLKLSNEEYDIYKYRRKGFSLFVEQNFISGLKHDFKVLVFGNRYFVLRRSIRKNDFRASGSGNFEFVDPPQQVLDYAKKIAKILDNPYLSLDIAQSDQGCHLIEFQGTNFGPYTLLNAPYRYISENKNWIKEENCKDLEANYAYALNHYLSNINE